MTLLAGPKPAGPRDVRHGRILVAEDDESNRLAASEVLAVHFELDFACSGAECLSVATRTCPDVILLDLVLGDHDGYETCRMLRNEPRLTGTKIVIVSGRATDEERVRGYAAGADDFLIKPYREEELLAKAFSYVRFRGLESAFSTLVGERASLRDSLASLVTHLDESLASFGSELLIDDAESMRSELVAVQARVAALARSLQPNSPLPLQPMVPPIEEVA